MYIERERDRCWVRFGVWRAASPLPNAGARSGHTDAERHARRSTLSHSLPLSLSPCARLCVCTTKPLQRLSKSYPRLIRCLLSHTHPPPHTHTHTHTHTYASQPVMAASSTTAVEPGDRYLTREPCCLQCCHRRSGALLGPLASSPKDDAVTSGDGVRSFPADNQAAWIAVKPYSYLFCAPVKGRWLGRGLLELFLEEFAFVPFDIAAGAPLPLAGELASVGTTTRTFRSAVVPLLLQLQAASPTVDVSGGATLDRRFTLPAYIEELCEGALWLRGRETECRAAGRRYQKALIDVVARARRVSLSVSSTDGCAAESGNSGEVEARQQMNPLAKATSSDALICAIPSSEASAVPSEWAAWCRTVLWLSELPFEAEVDALLQQVLLAASTSPPRDNAVAQGHSEADFAIAAAVSAAPPPLLSLQQRDVVQHLVWRCEGRMFAHPPLEIIRCDVAAALSTACSAAPLPGAQALAMIVVSKPPGMPVHPSGCYRKNTVTSILEDVMGGGDGDARRFYRIEEHLDHAATGGTLPHRPYASVVHKGGFELIRVWLRRPPCSEDASATVAANSSISTSADDIGVSAEDWSVLKTLFMREGEAMTQQGPLGHPKERLRARRHDAIALAAEKERRTKRQRAAEGSNDDHSSAANDNCSTATKAMRTSNGDAAAVVPSSYVMKAFVVHRLDAATGGVLLFGLNSNSARRLADAISNKAAHEGDGDGSADGREDMHSGAGSHTPASPLRAPWSRKVYCARVHGRVDLENLARVQHHCVLRGASLPAQSTSNGHRVPDDPLESACRSGAAPHSADTELLVCRPIGCLDHHNSLYWSPDAAITDVWQQQRADAKRQQQKAHKLYSISPSGGRGKGTRTPEAVAAKHERMRQLTRGGRTAFVWAAAPSLPPVNKGAAAAPAQEASTALSVSSSCVQRYMETLRSATTVLQVMRYDAAANQTVVKCTLGTGRTHQLRVHLASLGHPIVRDSKYAALEAHMRTLAEGGAHGTAAGRESASAVSGPGTPLASETSLHRFYESATADHSTGGRWQSEVLAAGRNARGCVCPEAIDLHAWQYTLAYEDGALVSVEVPLPSWAQ
ncbi:hypothetical protein CUR178_06703 [Leishmania enriettii]|uniref:Pseudouridine synthase RsuA/RluA-like domain-containing protein n=1 Tax=Leishmania enriettii TaxID=5663 RepID=A0A836HR42_LEIEN|nr:hypothetical protein CUR178_06703 [Leishmania enriettii]